MRSLIYVYCIILALVASTCGTCMFVFNHGAYDILSYRPHTYGSPTVVYDNNGTEIARFQRDVRSPTTINHIPDHVIYAFLAAEDHTFFHHTGISIPSILRSIAKNIYYRKIVQGASTITQQLVKMVHFTGEKHFSRKLKEQFLALLIERQCTKEQILQSYLSNIYLGCGIYGIQAGSFRFWGKSFAELTIDEAASIAAVVQSPATYCPLLHPDYNKTRRDLILSRMYALGYIDYMTCEHGKVQPITLEHEQQPSLHFPHVTEYLRTRLESTLGPSELYSGGYIVKTTLDATMQQQAEQAFHDHVGRYRATAPHIDGGMITIDTTRGGIKTMVGGYAFSESQFNRATQARRQMGSIFKPFVYAAAVETGFRLSETEIDEPISVGDGWSPRNVHRRHDGEMTYARALSHSNNVITVKLFLDLEPHTVIDCARRCRLPGPFPEYPSLALGCTECTVAEAAASFNIFANYGRYIEPYMIEWIKDRHGNKVWTHTTQSAPVMSWFTCSQITHVLHLTMDHIKSRMPHLWIADHAIGKTGTTNNARTCWFVGSTPDYTTALYIGRDDNAELTTSITSTYHALPIWLACHRQWDNKAYTTFYMDPRLTPTHIHAKTGDPVNSNHTQALLLYEPDEDITSQ